MVSSRNINKDGYTKCAVCGEKLFISESRSCAYCDKFFCRKHITKYNGLDSCMACAAAQKAKGGDRLAKKVKSSKKTTSKLEKAEGAADTAGALVMLASAAITVIKLLSKKK